MDSDGVDVVRGGARSHVFTSIPISIAIPAAGPATPNAAFASFRIEVRPNAKFEGSWGGLWC